MSVRLTRKPRTAVDRLANLLDIEVEHRSRGKYEIHDPSGAFAGPLYNKYRLLARLTLLALERGVPRRTLRQDVKWRAPVEEDKGENLKLFDAVGDSDARLLLDIYGRVS